MLADQSYSKRGRLVQYLEQLATVIDRLEDGCSPEKIAERLKMEAPGVGPSCPILTEGRAFGFWPASSSKDINPEAKPFEPSHPNLDKTHLDHV